MRGKGGKGLGRYRYKPPLPKEHYEAYFKCKWYDEWIESEWEAIRMCEVQNGDFTLDEAESRSHDDYKKMYPSFRKLMNVSEIADKEWESIIGDDPDFEYPELTGDAEDVWRYTFDLRDCNDEGADYDNLDSYWNDLWAEIRRIIRAEE